MPGLQQVAQGPGQSPWVVEASGGMVSVDRVGVVTVREVPPATGIGTAE